MSLPMPGSEVQEQGSLKSIQPISGGEEKPLSKQSSHDKAQSFLGVPLDFSARHSIETVSDISNLSNGHSDSENRTGRLLSSPLTRVQSASPGPGLETWRDQSTTFWSRNKGLVLVVIAQFFGAMMSLTTRLLETEGSHGARMHPFQILFVRMFVTLLFSLIYLYWAKIPHAPLGHKDVRGLLIARGVGGFFGVFGFFYSLQYLPIAEATIITFLAPTVAGFASWILIHEPFTRSQQMAGLVSLLGIVLIARPSSLFPGSSEVPPGAGGTDGIVAFTNSTTGRDTMSPGKATIAQRLAAIGFALIGVCGAACAYTTLRWIGKRAHPLISMTYFAAWCMIVSTVAIVAVPGIDFRLPSSLQEWMYLSLLGLAGFIMQFLLTAGLAHEKSSRATNMVYTQILFALAFDKIIFDTTPGGWSIVGSSLVLGSALYIAVHKEKRNKSVSIEEAGGAEELSLMADHESSQEDNSRVFREQDEG